MDTIQLRKMNRNERQAFRRLTKWDGEGKDLFWLANRVLVPNGYFTVDQAFIKLCWHRPRCKRTITELIRYFQLWVEEGMLIERRWWTESGSGGG